MKQNACGLLASGFTHVRSKIQPRTRTRTRCSFRTLFMGVVEVVTNPKVAYAHEQLGLDEL